MPSAILTHPAIWPQWAENWGGAPPPFGEGELGPHLTLRPFWRGGAGSPSNNVVWDEAYLRTKWHLDVSSRLATIEMGRKLGRGGPLFGEGGWVRI